MDVELYIAMGIAVIVVLWGIVSRNKFIKEKISIEESISGIDVALKKRYDLLTNEIAAVKGYAKYEASGFENVTKIRKEMSIREKSDLRREISQNHSDILALSENYPKLKASNNFKHLQASIVDVEEHLQAARRVYNVDVAIFNRRLHMIPSNIIGKLMGLQDYDFFEAEDTELNIKEYGI